MLSDYKGPANTRAVLRHLVGARIAACFQVPAATGDGGLDTYIVDESGCALVFHHSTGAYWVESKAEVDLIIAKRRAEIEQRVAELRDLLPGGGDV